MFYLKQLSWSTLGILLLGMGFLLRSIMSNNDIIGSIIVLAGFVFLEESLRNMWKYKRGKWVTSSHEQRPLQ